MKPALHDADGDVTHWYRVEPQGPVVYRDHVLRLDTPKRVAPEQGFVLSAKIDLVERPEVRLHVATRPDRSWKPPLPKPDLPRASEEELDLIEGLLSYGDRENVAKDMVRELRDLFADAGELRKARTMKRLGGGVLARARKLLDRLAAATQLTDPERVRAYLDGMKNRPVG